MLIPFIISPISLINFNCVGGYLFIVDAFFNVCLLFFQENDPTLMGRVKKSDAREMQSFYQHYYKKYIQALQNAADKADRLVLVHSFNFFSRVYCLLWLILADDIYLLMFKIIYYNAVHSSQKHIKRLMSFLRF